MSSNRFEDEFSVHFISSASMKFFQENTLVSFRTFFNDEISLIGEWRVAPSEIMFPTQIERIVNGDLVAFSLRETKKPGNWIWCSFATLQWRRITFMAGKYDTVAQLLDTIKRKVGLLNFSFREIKSSGKYEIIFGKYEGIAFQSEEILSIIGFKGIPDGIRSSYWIQNDSLNREPINEKWWHESLLWWFSCRPFRWKAFIFLQKHFWVSVCGWCESTIVKSHWIKTAFEKR